nr:dienelactone hydrolase family protein [Bdellovibrio sp. HAGR004]
MNLRNLMVMAAIILSGAFARAEVKAETVEYKDGKTILEGFLAYDEAIKGPRPAVIIVHQWMGLTDHEKNSARMLAEKGYVVLAADIYGKGKRPGNQTEAGKLAGEYKGNTKLFREREKAAFEFLKKNKNVDAKHIVIMGYCFGGTGALEAARSGLPVVGAVSVHGGLASGKPEEAKNIKGKVLVLHGAIDPYVPTTEVEGFMKEMNDAKVDYQFIAYSGAVHAFTQKEAGNDPSKGAAYNEAAARRSWQALLTFLDEVAPVSVKK